MPEGIEFSTIVSLIDVVVAGIRDLANEIATARDRSIRVDTFPDLDEMSKIQAVTERADLKVVAKDILAMLPEPVAAAFGSVETREQGLLNHITAATSYPDLFKRHHTPERIARALMDLAAGYVSVLTVTWVRGVRPVSPMTVAECTIAPAASFDGLWFRSQVPWGTMVPCGFGHAILFREEKVLSASVDDDSYRNEPTANALQSLRLATTSEVLSIGSLQRGLVFDPMILRRRRNALGSGTRWWAPQHIGNRIGCVVLTQDHLGEAEYLAPFVDDEDGILAVPIRRFDMAIKRPDAKDQLVDLAVAAEALFLAADEKEVLTYRLRMRASCVLAPPEQREVVGTWISDMYDLRSAIVHGDREPKRRLRAIMTDGTRLREEVYKFAELVRSGIRWGARLVSAGHTDLPLLFDQLLLSAPNALSLFERIELPALPAERLDETAALSPDLPRLDAVDEVPSG